MPSRHSWVVPNTSLITRLDARVVSLLLEQLTKQLKGASCKCLGTCFVQLGKNEEGFLFSACPLDGVRESEFKSENPRFDPLAGQGESQFVSVPPNQFLCIFVCVRTLKLPYPSVVKV